MMARTTSIIVQNLVEIARRTSAWEDELICDVFNFVCYTGRYCRRSAGIVFNHGRFLGFSPRTDQGVIWQEGALLHAKFHLDRSRGGGLRPPKLGKIWILPI